MHSTLGLIQSKSVYLSNHSSRMPITLKKTLYNNVLLFHTLSSQRSGGVNAYNQAGACFGGGAVRA